MTAVRAAFMRWSRSPGFVYLDALYRNPLMMQPLVRLHFAPTAATAATLVLIAIMGTPLPLRRVVRLDVMRTVQGSG